RCLKELSTFFVITIRNIKIITISMLKEYLFNNHWSKKVYSDSNIIYTIGWAEYENNILDANGLISTFEKNFVLNQEDISKFATKLNGNFSNIITNPNKTIIISDILRTYPVIYFFNGENIVVTDNIYSYLKKFNHSFKIDEVCLEQYLCTDYVIGPYTIFKD